MSLRAFFTKGDHLTSEQFFKCHLPIDEHVIIGLVDDLENQLGRYSRAYRMRLTQKTKY